MDEKAVSAFAQTTRKQILEELLKQGTHASELARKIEVDRPTICYHLSRLEEANLIAGEYVILAQNSPGRAAKIYSVNKEKYAQTLKEAHQVKEMLEQTK